MILAQVNGCLPGNCSIPADCCAYPTAVEWAVFAVWIAWGILGAYLAMQTECGMPVAPQRAPQRHAEEDD